MRPLDPIKWAAFSAPGGVASLGVTVLSGQRAALLGSKGRFLDLGVLDASFRFDRVLVSVGGSGTRRFTQQDRFSAPAPGVREGDDDRSDAGVVWASTTVALGVPEGESPRDARLAVRFGVRLPTTDDVQGIERDETDFFASVGGRHVRGAWELSGEVGAGIFGVYGERFAQTDPYHYAVGVRRLGQRARPYAELTGHFDTRTNGAPRGNEDQSELRLGAEIGGLRWLDLHAIVGLAEYSPDFGVQVRVGTVF
ncbi:MAG: hypothetical protein OEO23_14045 [Gemmatimonadota bacterium]|nr:hypothetical protein [Gemmatimonadota bacterium]